MKIVSIEWLTDEIMKRLNNEETCYLSSDGNYWLFTDNDIFNKISGKFRFDEKTEEEHRVQSLNISDWLHFKCNKYTSFMGNEYDWNDYVELTRGTIENLDIFTLCNNKWDQIIIEYLKEEIVADISNDLEDSLKSMNENDYDLQIMRDTLAGIFDFD